MKKVMLDGGVIVEVSRLQDKDQLRAAAIFNPKIVDSASRGDTLRNSDAIALWRGNEAYIMFVIERACKLTSKMTPDKAWLSRIRRNAAAYNILNQDDLEDESYQEALYIRYVGMTTDRYVSLVTDLAMGVKRTDAGNLTLDSDEEEEGVVDSVVSEDEDDEEGDVQAIVPAKRSPAKATSKGNRVR